MVAPDLVDGTWFDGAPYLTALRLHRLCSSSTLRKRGRRQRRQEAVEPRIRLGGFIDLREMAGVGNDLDADGGDAGAERVQIGRGLALADRPPLAPLVA